MSETLHDLLDQLGCYLVRHQGALWAIDKEQGLIVRMGGAKIGQGLAPTPPMLPEVLAGSLDARRSRAWRWGLQGRRHRALCDPCADRLDGAPARGVARDGAGRTGVCGRGWQGLRCGGALVRESAPKGAAA